MSHTKYYCLKCERPNNCTCGTDQYQFIHNCNLRPPHNTKNKAKFRKFLDDCPTFVNLVPEHLKPRFVELLRKVKYFDKAINGRQWTRISK